MRFDTVLVVDWSAAAKARRPSPDSIWIGAARDDTVEARHFATRPDAEGWLSQQITRAGDLGERLLIGFDFAFGFPAGAARALTGRDDPCAIWSWLAARILESRDGANNRFAVAVEANRRFGRKVFWGADLDPDITLRRETGAAAALGLAAHRAVEGQAKGAKSVWQLTGAGAVGSQSLVGLPMIHRLSQLPSVAVWPFDTPDRIVMAEVYPSLLRARVEEEVARGWMRDAAQVRLLSLALWRLGRTGRLANLLAAPTHPAARQEGWILGVGHEDDLQGALA
jgi:hypothetical protein